MLQSNCCCMNVDKKSGDHSDVLLLKTVGVDSDHNGLVFLVYSVPLVESLQKNYNIQIQSCLVIKQRYIIRT